MENNYYINAARLLKEQAERMNLACTIKESSYAVVTISKGEDFKSFIFESEQDEAYNFCILQNGMAYIKSIGGR